MFKRLAAGIAKTRNNLLGSLKGLFGAKLTIDDATLETLETTLLTADCGIPATERIVAAIRKRGNEPDQDLREALSDEMSALLKPCEQPLEIDPKRTSPFVILVVGVNGAGKTTTIAKIGRRYKDAGFKVMFAAGDTFRAAAVEQLTTWGQRLGIPVIAQATGADPASVLYDACSAAASRGIDVLIADTAGRLHTQANLMGELEKVKRIIGKFDAKAPHETLLVLDATMGQNALSQATLFNEKVTVDALCLTKLDGTAKGGIVFALAESLGLPIRYIGVGEADEDLRDFDAKEFVAALLEDAEFDTDAVEQ